MFWIGFAVGFFTCALLVAVLVIHAIATEHEIGQPPKVAPGTVPRL